MVPALPALFAAARKVLAHAPAPLWLDFQPSHIPLLLFDGEHTYLTGGAPRGTGWRQVGEGWGWRGLHPALTGNTCAEVEPGLLAAGVLLPSLGRVDAPALAAIFAHEAFHVWQRQHPSSAWKADELAALNYPDTAAVLHARAEEAFWLKEALTQQTLMQKPHGHPAPAALAHAHYWRQERFLHLSDRHRQLERRMETLEGLAHFVEQRVLGQTALPAPHEAIRATARAWAYSSGAALAHLLGAHLPQPDQNWPRRVMAGEALDTLLYRYPPQPAPAHAELRAAAAEQVSQLEQEKVALLAQFAAQAGAHGLLTCNGNFTIAGFDPMNVVCVGKGQWLHRRYLHLRCPAGHLEVRQGLALVRGPDLSRAQALELACVPQPTPQKGRWQVQDEAFSIDLELEAANPTPQGWSIQKAEK